MDNQISTQYIDEKFEKIDQRFVKMDQRFEKMDERFVKMDEKFEELLLAVKRGFDATASKESMERVETRLDKVESHLQGIDNKLKRHLEISDDRHFDHQRLHKVYQYWFEKIAKKVDVELDVPEFRSPHPAYPQRGEEK